MQYKNYLSFIVLFFVCTLLNAQEGTPYFGESCTSIMVGKNATTDGSVITSHTCDGNYRTWLEMVPAMDHADTVLKEIKWGTLHTETPWDTRKLELKGTIPQVSHTFAFLNTAYPCLNEKQLGIGETTFVGKRELRNKKGLFLIEDLQRIALERCSTARDAIKLIGELILEYGYGDYGECITIADKNEVWQLEILGEGPDKVGGVWAAQRIPDGHVGISANIARIGEIDFKDKDYFMASKNVKKVAKKLDYWDGKKPFVFWKAYSNWDKPFSIREYFVLNAVAPSLKLDYTAEEIPFSVKPDEKVSVEKVMELYRETYADTDYDMLKNLFFFKDKKNKEGEVIGQDTIVYPGASPWMSRDLIRLFNSLKDSTVVRVRTVAVAWCSYSEIIQLRDWLPDEVGGVAWFSFDNAAQSPRIPIFAGSTSLPKGFEVCGQHQYREDAAIWNFRKANKLATVNWQKSKEIIDKNVMAFQTKALEDMPVLEAKVKALITEGKTEEAREYLTKYTETFAGSAMQKWLEMEKLFWGKYGRAF